VLIFEQQGAKEFFQVIDSTGSLSAQILAGELQSSKLKESAIHV
jgi:hypothetical protein